MSSRSRSAGTAGAVLVLSLETVVPAYAGTDAGSKSTLCAIAGSVSPTPAITYTRPR